MRWNALRARSDDAAPRVTNMELFFDLVYVFAITQLSDFLFKAPTFHRALEGLVMFGAVWWAWNYTAWATNWLDPESIAGAALMIVLMAISLVMSAAIPEAFDGRGAPFAFAYVGLQVVRSGFMVRAFTGTDDRMRRNYTQLLAWSCIAGVIWIVGAFVPHELRLWLWLAALAVDLAAPVHGFRLPGVGATPMEDWSLAGGHLAERCQLVLMIALGESVLRVGLTFSQKSGSPSVDGAFVVGFLICAGLWAMYFLRYAERGAEAISSTAADAARVGRTAYAYAHAMMVAGVILVAVGIHLAIDNPDEGASAASALTMLGGPALFLAGLALFKRAVGHRSLRAPLIAIGVLAVFGAVAAFGADQLVVMVCATLVVGAMATLAVTADS
ncbi:MAG: low temperature requirement protein A, partial [Solirubrobacteraceae bacterium]